MVDCGVFSPTGTFRRIFQNEGVEITESEARGPMGIHKRDHIAKILDLPDVIDRWVQTHGRPPTDVDIDRMYAAFTPLQVEAVKAYATPIAGVPAVCEQLRARHIKIGSCTGFPMAVVDVLRTAAAAGGYTPDCYVAADEVCHHRSQVVRCNCRCRPHVPCRTWSG